MRFMCDHCGTCASPKENNNFVDDWDTVTISALPKYDVCPDCAKLLFGFLGRQQEQTQAYEAYAAIAKPKAGAAIDPGAL